MERARLKGEAGYRAWREDDSEDAADYMDVEMRTI